jgi:hypothetical protein
MAGILHGPLTHGQVRAHGAGPEHDRQAYEKKPDNLIPQSPGRFEDSRHYVLDELPPAIR